MDTKKIVISDHDVIFVKPTAEYADEIRSYRQDFLDSGDHMDGCGPLRKFEDPLLYIKECALKSAAETAAEAGGHAEQFLLIRKADQRLVAMAQYRYGVDPLFCIGYSVRPSERKKGYAKRTLRYLLQWLSAQGYSDTFISCEPSNEASRQVILSCGGAFVELRNYKGIDLMLFHIEI